MQQKNTTNTDSSKFEIEDKPMVNDNNNNSIKYFLPDPTGMLSNRQVMKSHNVYKESLKMYLMVLGALMAHFHYRSNQIASHTRCPQEM